MTTPMADRTRDGLFALILALKKKPAIRYQVSSHDAGHIAALRKSVHACASLCVYVEVYM